MTDVRIRPADFDFVRDLVRRRSAIVLEPGKEYLVETRLLPLARTIGDETVSRFIARLRTAATGPARRRAPRRHPRPGGTRHAQIRLGTAAASLNPRLLGGPGRVHC